MEPAFILPSMMLTLLILDVELGIGTTEFALFAPTDGSRMLTVPVCPFLINALLMLLTEIVHPASRDTISPTELVSSLPTTTFSLLT